MKKGTKALLYGIISLAFIGGGVGLYLYLNNPKKSRANKAREELKQRERERLEALNNNSTTPTDTTVDLGVGVDDTAQPQAVDEVEEAIQEEINTTDPEDGGYVDSFISAGDTIYPFNDYINVRTSPEVDNGWWDNLDHVVFAPEAIGVVLASQIVGDHVWYTVDVPIGRQNTIGMEALDWLGAFDYYVRADMVTKSRD